MNNSVFGRALSTGMLFSSLVNRNRLIIPFNYYICLYLQFAIDSGIIRPSNWGSVRPKCTPYIAPLEPNGPICFLNGKKNRPSRLIQHL